MDARPSGRVLRSGPDAQLRVRRKRLGLPIRREDAARPAALGQLTGHGPAGAGRAGGPHALQRAGGQRQRQQRRDGSGQGRPGRRAPRDRQGPHRRGLRRPAGSRRSRSLEYLAGLRCVRATGRPGRRTVQRATSAIGLRTRGDARPRVGLWSTEAPQPAVGLCPRRPQFRSGARRRDDRLPADEQTRSAIHCGSAASTSSWIGTCSCSRTSKSSTTQPRRRVRWFRPMSW